MRALEPKNFLFYAAVWIRRAFSAYIHVRGLPGPVLWQKPFEYTWKGAGNTVSKGKSPFLNMGCTCFSWETEEGMHLLGRTYDQCGNLLGNRIAVVPRNYPLRLEIQDKAQRHVRSRYSFGGMAIMGLDSPVMVDGINEMGVMDRAAGSGFGFLVYLVFVPIPDL